MWRSRYPRSSDPEVRAAQQQAARWRACLGIAVVAGLLGLGVIAGHSPASSGEIPADEVSVSTPELPA
jgi:hypothetical protein